MSIGVDSVTGIVTWWQKSSIIDINRQSIVDFEGESTNSTARRGFVTARRPFRRLIVDFDDESMIRDDSLTQSVSESSISTRNRRFRRTTVALDRLFVILDRLIVTLGRLTVDFDRESSISTESRHFGAIDRHFGAMDRRFRRRVIDFDRDRNR